MSNKELINFSLPTELYHIELLQNYICRLAEIHKVAEEKHLPLSIVIEEVFSHIVKNAFGGRNDGEIHVGVRLSSKSFIVKFRYKGLPFGYNIESAKSMEDYISNTLIQSLCSSYSMSQDGKNGESIEFCIDLPKAETAAEQPQALGACEEVAAVPNEELCFREIRKEDLKSLIQCLYQVFGYSYSGEGVYRPEDFERRMKEGVYRGFAAIAPDGMVVAHAALMKEKAESKICECGQAFVMPQYNNRGLFKHLKKQLIEAAGRDGLLVVMSSAVTGHPYTQKANIAIGCVETGLKLGYIPSNLQSMIKRDAAHQRQSVMECVLPLEDVPQKLYIPEKHSAIIKRTYEQLKFERNWMESLRTTEDWDESSQLGITVLGDWGQMILDVHCPGKDLSSKLLGSILHAISAGTKVIYARLLLTSPDTPLICSVMEKLGFFYAGIIPYEDNGTDVLHLQFLAEAQHITRDSVVAYSDWGKELTAYIFSQKENASENLLTENP